MGRLPVAGQNLDDALAARLGRQCLAVLPGERFLLLGPPRLAPFYRRLHMTLRQAGARVRTHVWADQRPRLPSAPAPGLLRLRDGLTPIDKVVLAADRLRDADHHRLRQWLAAGIAHVLLEYDPASAACRRALDIDYAALCRQNARLQACLSGKEVLAISDARGTNLRAVIAGRPVWREDCCFGPAERVLQLPGGEVFVAPLEDSVSGAVCLDLALHGVVGGGVVKLTVRAGRLVGLTAPAGAAWAAAIGRQLGIGSERVGEIGFGTNPAASSDDPGAMGEKALGTVHLGIGDNTHMGGRHRSCRHLDLILPSPTVRADGCLIIDRGRPAWAREAAP